MNPSGSLKGSERGPTPRFRHTTQLVAFEIEDVEAVPERAQRIGRRLSVEGRLGQGCEGMLNVPAKFAVAD